MIEKYLDRVVKQLDEKVLRLQEAVGAGAAKADQLEIEKQRIESQEKIAAMNATLKSQKDRDDRMAKQEEAGARLGVDLAKTKQQLDQQNRQYQQQSQKPQKGNK